jgi:hypothetical protein
MNEWELQSKWVSSPLALLNTPARRLRMGALLAGGLQREIEAWRAELATLADLEAPWLWEGRNPFSGLSAMVRTSEPTALQLKFEDGNVSIVASAAERSYSYLAREMPELAASGEAKGSQSGDLYLSSHSSSDQKSRDWSSDLRAGLAMWAVRRGRSKLVAAAHRPIGRFSRAVESLYRRALTKAFEDESPAIPLTDRDTVQMLIEAPAHSSHHRASDSLDLLPRDGRSEQKTLLRVMADEHERRVPFPPAAALLSRLTDRWYAARAGLDTPHQPSEVGRMAVGVQSPHAIAMELQGPLNDETEVLSNASRQLKEPVSNPMPGYGQAIVLEGGERTAHMQWITPVAHNTIHLTVQPPPLVNALDPDELADLLDRILRQEARRHGISLM